MLLVVLGAAAGIHPSFAQAQEEELSVTFMPIRSILIDGDDQKFRAHHWMKDPYAGGISSLVFKHQGAAGMSVSGQGHALAGQNDLAAELLFKKESLGFFSVDFAQFPKYEDGTGGVYHLFGPLQVNETDKELTLEIGKLNLETGLTLPGWPELSFLYEREFKDGAKSRLTWTAVREGAVTRNIGPSWQEVEEKVDLFALKAHHEAAGFQIQGQQRWEFVRSELFREERSLSTTTTASDKKIRRQDQAPEADLATTTLSGQRHFLNEKIFVSGGYRFAHMDNREFESLLEFNADGSPRNFSNPKQQVNARADNDYDTHTWVGNFVAAPCKWLSLGARMKSEVVKRESNASYPTDAVPNSAGGSIPNGIIDRTDVSLNDSKAVRWGEGFSLRFTGIPRTALYTELELEQGRVLLREDRKSLDGPDAGNGASADEVFNRRTITHVQRGAVTVGGQTAPWTFLDLTAHFRYRRNNNDYDDQQETSPGASAARSAFIDGQVVETQEVATRLKWKPCRRFTPSLRYQLREEDYQTRVENELPVGTGVTRHIYTFDVILEPLKDLLTTLSFSRQAAATATPARFAPNANTPTFNANVNTWLASADYPLCPHVAVNGTLEYSRARNFNDFASTGLPLGADFDELDLTTALTWTLREGVSLTGRYGFYHYQPNSRVETGDYNAHVIWIEASKKF